MVHSYTVQDAVSVNRIRSITAQFIACLAPNILLMDIGMSITFSTITVPVLLNAPEGISFNDVQASWYGSLAFLVQPIGALLSGPLVDYLGRKKGSLLSIVPHIIAWTFSYFAWNLPSLFLANILLGLGTGLMEAPVNAYVAEVTEPSIRGSMSTLSQAWTSVGILLILFLGTVVTWRSVALISLTIPAVSILTILMAPETPIWLLSQGREEEALKSLCHLRGWTTPFMVKEEFDNLLKYSKTLKQCIICESTEIKGLQCKHVNMNLCKRSLLKFRYLMLCKETLRPFILCIMYFVLLTMSGLTPVRSNMVNVCDAFGMAEDGKYVSVIVGVLLLLGSIISALVIKFLGKRKVAISTMFGTFVCSLALSIYAKQNLSEDVFSYNTKTFPTTKSYLPLVFFYILAFFTGFNIPWVLVGEVFPFRSRATAQGITAAGSYVIAFVATKSFFNLEINMHLWGTFAVYSAFGLAGTLYLYLYLPETEGKTLQEIESFFNGDYKIFADDPIINCFKAH